MNYLSKTHHSPSNLKHFSEDNKNIISWHPFKKSDNILIVNARSIPISKFLQSKTNHVTIITQDNIFLEHFKKTSSNNQNSTLVTTNISNLKNSKKFNYIFLEDLDNKNLKDILPILSKHLEDNGIIFYPFANTFGLSSLISDPPTTSHSRQDLEDLAKQENLELHFYNVFPSHYLPELLFTDDYLKITHNLSYTPIYFESNIISQNELKLFHKFLRHGSLPQHSNSYLAMFGKSDTKSKSNSKPKIKYVKYNNYRKDKYNLITYFKNGNYYKRANSPSATPFLNEIYENYQELKNWDLNILEVKKKDEIIYSPRLEGENLIRKFYNDYKYNQSDFYKSLSDFWLSIKNCYTPTTATPNDNIFTKYNLEISNEKQQKLHYVPKLYIDMIPQNVIVHNHQQYFFDQEWYMLDAPLEFLLYRIINYTAAYVDPANHLTNLDILLDKFQLKDYQQEFRLLEDAFVSSVWNNWYKYYQEYQSYQIGKDYLNETASIIQAKDKHISDLEQQLIAAEQNLASVSQDLNKILNSKSWKLTKPLRELSKKVNGENSN